MTCSGSVFQMRAPATGKAREPTEVSRTVIKGSGLPPEKLHLPHSDAAYITQPLFVLLPLLLLRILGLLLRFLYNRSNNPNDPEMAQGQARCPFGDCWCEIFYRADALPVTNQQRQNTILKQL